MEWIFILGIGVILALFIVFLAVWIMKGMKGKIEIKLNSYSFSPGQKISGSILLKLKKPIEKGQLFVQLIGERKQTNYLRNGPISQTFRIFDFEYQISEQKSMPAGEFNISFDFPIPNNLSTQPKFDENPIGTLLKSAQILIGQNVNVNWWLVGKLKCEGLDLSKKVRVNII